MVDLTGLYHAFLAVYTVLVFCPLVVIIFDTLIIFQPIGSEKRFRYNTWIVFLGPIGMLTASISLFRYGYNADYFFMAIQFYIIYIVWSAWKRAKDDDNWFDDFKKKMKKKAESLKTKRFGVGVTTGGRW